MTTSTYPDWSPDRALPSVPYGSALAAGAYAPVPWTEPARARTSRARHRRSLRERLRRRLVTRRSSYAVRTRPSTTPSPC